MRINAKKCVGCRLCLPYCPVGAIKVIGKKCSIDKDECVECYVCFRSRVCPTEAFQKMPLKWPRTIRHQFSSAPAAHESTGMTGRGTEEMKTNDVTGRYGFGEVGFTVDVGRPGVGTSLEDVEKILKAVAQVGVEFEPKNPVTMLMVSKKLGVLSKEVKKERVLSCIVEFKTSEGKLLNVVNALEDVAKRINTVFTVGCINRVKPDGEIPAKDLLDKAGIFYRANGKTNLGLASRNR